MESGRKDFDAIKLPDFTVVKYDPTVHSAALLNKLDEFKDEFGHLLTVMGVGGLTTGATFYVSLFALSGFWALALTAGGVYFFREQFGWSQSWEDFYRARDEIEKIFQALHQSDKANLTFDPVYLKFFQTVASFKDPAEVENLIPKYKLLSPKFIEIVRGYLPGYKPNKLEQDFLALNASDNLNITEDREYLKVFGAVLVSIKDNEIVNYIPKDKPLSSGFLDMVRARLPKYEPPKDQPKKEKTSLFSSTSKVTKGLSISPAPEEKKANAKEQKDQSVVLSKQLPGAVEAGLAKAKVAVFKKRQTLASFIGAGIAARHQEAEAAKAKAEATKEAVATTVKLVSKLA